MSEANQITSKTKTDKLLKRLLKWLFIFVGIFLFTFLFYKHWTNGVDPKLYEQVVRHYAVFLCIPCAALGALILVVIFDEAFGQIKFSVWQLTFEGAAAPLIMYLLCFLCIIFSIKLLW